MHRATGDEQNVMAFSDAVPTIDNQPPVDGWSVALDGSVAAEELGRFRPIASVFCAQSLWILRISDMEQATT